MQQRRTCLIRVNWGFVGPCLGELPLESTDKQKTLHLISPASEDATQLLKGFFLSINALQLRIVL